MEYIRETAGNKSTLHILSKNIESSEIEVNWSPSVKPAGKKILGSEQYIYCAVDV